MMQAIVHRTGAPVVAITLVAVVAALSSVLAGCGATLRSAPASSMRPFAVSSADSSLAAPHAGASGAASPVATSATSVTSAASSAAPTRPSVRPGSPASGAARFPPFATTMRTVTAADLPKTYRAGCPTPPSALRMLTLSFVDFAGHAESGHLVVNAAQTTAVTAVFAALYAERFPIRKMVPVDAYGGSDERSVADDNTAGFNCRPAVNNSGTTSWSMHAYGDAVDVDPVENPYVYGGMVDPTDGAPFVDRSDRRPGMATADGELVAAFARQGWRWGASFGDYQHFSTNGT